MINLKHALAAFLLTMASTGAYAEVADVTAGGWYEGGYVTWTKTDGYCYNVYVQASGSDTWTQLDGELVREYPDYGRADALGLAAGDYRFKVVPTLDGSEVSADATESDYFTATAYDRSGYAHFNTSSSTFNVSDGVGAYKNDGTLKDGAKVFYVTASTASTITTDVTTNSKGSTTSCTGLQTIIDAYQKGYDTTPIAFRIIGKVTLNDLDHYSSSAEGLQIKGKNSYSELNITMEGVGNDATIHGFGFLLRNATSVELRNFAVMNCLDDCISIDTDNSNIWVHNIDLFYGQAGGDSDQTKGDGTIDLKGDSQYITISYNHLWDSGKASLCGMTSESGPNYITYHHNWFDHSDSRHPRIRTMSVHIYNNYFDGNAKYGVGVTTGADAFVENNYFRNCKYPMLTSLQGSDVHNGVGSSDDTKGTFSSEEGGSIKAYGNYITGATSFEPYVEGDETYATHFDAYVVSSRTDTVPGSVVSLSGSNTYSNFDVDESLMYQDYTVDAAEDVPSIITGSLGAGRCQHGDFQWTFGSSEDTNSDVITELKSAITSYESTLIGIYGTASNDTTTTDTTDEDDSSDTGDDTTADATTGSTVYSYTLTGTLSAAVVDGTTQNYSDTIAAIGGSFIAGNVAKIETSSYATSGYAMKLDGDASATSTKYAYILLDNPLALGDVINVICYCTSTPSNNYGVSLYAERDGSALASAYNTAKNTEETLSITVDNTMAGLTEFYLFRNTSKSIYLSAVNVTSTPTGVQAITAASNTNASAVYNLLGQKVQTLQKGQVYILNNKKFVAF